MQAVAERVPIMTSQQVCQGRQAIREIVAGIALSKISDRVQKQKNK